MRLLKSKNMEDLELSVASNAQNTKLQKAVYQRGSTTRLILNIINKGVVELYKYTDERQETCFLSTAEGDEIDELAALINCQRNGLNDIEYKEKIRNYTTILEKANVTSIFWSARLPGIIDMDFKKNSLGANSFSIIPYADVPLINQNILDEVKLEVSNVVSYGTRFQVINPILLRTSVKIKPIYYQRYNSYHLDEDGINALIFNNIVKYLGSLRSGVPFDKSMLLKTIKDDNDGISSHLKDIIITELIINKQKIKDDFFAPGWNQRIIENELENSIEIEA